MVFFSEIHTDISTILTVVVYKYNFYVKFHFVGKVSKFEIYLT